ncbi:cell division protein FtsZ [Thioalkalivibrio sp. XN279]|uniref:cell division protein FtsZ n=1 Tax=Thioalkalivibrio sp. XN279 TaxID=2714953 RepID=UPI0014077100|nr:cell division protein FtsZ [Thioalkalivibrio sp. XN279]NHA16068.1 cell division protein FtsZ [Thioalkalivibrio sp. XN279]
MFELVDGYNSNAVIKVIGVGGGGGNAVSHMMDCGIDGVEFICANTDSQALKNSRVKTAIQIGCNITKGLGAGANPDLGRQAAMEDRDRLREAIEGSDMLFITAGMGGGTGTGAAPIVAQVAKELGILTVAVVTKPFGMEGRKRADIADQGITELAKHVDSLITIPNQKLLTVLGKTTTLLDAFRSANEVLQGAVQGIAELITRPGLINVDFADVRTVMSEMGMAMMGTGRGTGEDRARDAAEAAISSPLLEDINLEGANGILVNITAGMDLAIGEFDDVGMVVKDRASDDATVVIGTVIDPAMEGEVRVTVVATGLGGAIHQRKPTRQAARQESEPHARAPRVRVVADPARPVNYNDLESPPVARRRASEDEHLEAPKRAVGQSFDYPADTEMLDIPAFLRRQAD